MTRIIRLRRELHTDGLTDSDIRAAVEYGGLIRLAPGAYVSDMDYRQLNWEERYRLTVQAVARRRTADIVVSHVSAAALLGLPLVDTPCDVVHLTQPRRGGVRRRRTNQVAMHSGRVPQADRVTIDGIALTAAARTLVDVSRTESPTTAVVAIIAALQRELVQPEQLTAALAARPSCAGLPRARRAVARALGDGHTPCAQHPAAEPPPNDDLCP